MTVPPNMHSQVMVEPWRKGWIFLRKKAKALSRMFWCRTTLPLRRTSKEAASYDFSESGIHRSPNGR
ncbi:MAG TPA: hypothetical protein VJW76_12680, partial [Verrucomicrobiae bacterium]|nr:hypothetical protein [Verrucomicrobiae bacterium]